MRRRDFVFGSLAGAMAWAGRAASAASPEFRIGFQKSGVLLIARQQELIERRLAPAGVGVKWIEFPSGPPLLEAMNAGSIDFGLTGDTPPIFAQAAGASLVYVAALAPNAGGDAAAARPAQATAQARPPNRNCLRRMLFSAVPPHGRGARALASCTAWTLSLIHI